MDIKEYISSGIIESYVLGQVSEQERREVECMSSIYPEIAQELRLFQEKVGQIAEDNAIIPPSNIKTKVLEAVFKEIDKDQNSKGHLVEGNFTSTKNNDTVQIWKYVAAAGVLLFVISTTLFWNTYNEQNKEQQALLKKNEELEHTAKEKESALDEITTDFIHTKEKIAILADINTKQVNLAGTDLSSHSNVSIFWNKDRESVYLKVNDLPETPSAKQYQLWAIVDGVPTDMGMLPIEHQFDELVEMPYKVNNPAAFAITLEDKGGRPEPDLEALYVIGEVKI